MFIDETLTYFDRLVENKAFQNIILLVFLLFFVLDNYSTLYMVLRVQLD